MGMFPHATAVTSKAFAGLAAVAEVEARERKRTFGGDRLRSRLQAWRRRGGLRFIGIDSMVGPHLVEGPPPRRSWRRPPGGVRASVERIRRSVQRRFGDVGDMTKLEPQLRALLDREVQSAPPVRIVELIDITDREGLRKVLEEEQTSDASKADAIASAIRRALNERMEEDPALYASFSQMLEETISAYRAKRMSEKDYLSKVTDLAEQTAGRPRRADAPASIRDDPAAQAFFGAMRELPSLKQAPEEAAALVARDMADIIRGRLIVRFWANEDEQKALRNALDDYLFDVAPEHGLEISPGSIDELLDALLHIARAQFPR